MYSNEEWILTLSQEHGRPLQKYKVAVVRVYGLCVCFGNQMVWQLRVTDVNLPAVKQALVLVCVLCACVFVGVVSHNALPVSLFYCL